MSVHLKELGIAAVVALFCVAAAGQTRTPVTPQKSAAPASTAKRRVNKPSPAKQQPPAPAPEPVAQQPPPPPPPQRPYEMSPVPPQVTFSGGELTIIAPNSSLADILNAVKQRIGARVEFPSSAAQERVAVQLGPGNPRDVLTELLSGSPFDYILLGSDQDPTAVTQMIVTRRQATGTAVAAAGSTNPAPPQPEPASEDDDNDQPAEAQNPNPARPVGIGQPVPGQPINRAPGAPQQIGQPAPMANTPDQNAPQTAEPGAAQPAQNGPKTPEQLLQELQRMQRQEQQRPQPKPPQL